jgi:O-antigen/teichoic acid export membrane protein
MQSNLDSNIPIITSEISAEARMAKNSIALFLFAILTKAFGVIIAVLIARFLGAAALGTYAAVMALSLLLENMVPFGQPFVIIRQVARDRTRLLSFWLNTSVITFLLASVVSCVLAIVIHLFVKDVEYATSAYIVAIYLPMAGLFGIAVAFVQGLELMESLTVSALLGRVIGLLVLWFLLKSGLGVAAAFIGHGLYQIVAFFILFWIIRRKTDQPGVIQELKLDLAQCWTTLRISFPLAIQTLLRSGLDQLSVLILPLLVAMAIIGMFDAADRIRQISVMIVPIVTLSILPTLSRTIISDRENAIALMETALKLLQMVILPFVVFVAIAADQIIRLMYGSGYEGSIPVLRIVVWAQIFFVVDAVLNQSLLASNNEKAMVRFTALSMGVNIILLLALAPHFGAVGAAWAMILTYALNLGLDLQFVVRHISALNFFGTISKILPCTIISGCIALLAHGFGIWVSFVLFAGSYAILLWVLKVFTVNELNLAHQLTIQLWRKVVTPREQQIK